MGCGASAPVAAASTATAAREGCFIGPGSVGLKLANVLDYNHDTKIFEFGLPDGQSLNLPVCACILLKGRAADGQDAVRPYTPISDNTMLGKFQLLIKTYEQGVVSKYVHGLSIGDEVEFTHIPPNVKIQHPFKAQVEGGGPVRTVSMLCGGTGIVRLLCCCPCTTPPHRSVHFDCRPQAPMYQALRRVLDDPADSTEVTLLYGSKKEEDVLLRAELDALAAKHPEQLKLHYILSDGAPEGWAGKAPA